MEAIVSRKVQAGGAAGALTVILVWAAGTAGLDVPAEVASAFTTLIAAAAGWLIPEPKNVRAPG
jgi:hypothetical protein